MTDLPPEMEQGFTIKDSGKRQEYASGMRRDVVDGKADYSLVFDGPLIDRYAEHMTKGAAKYGTRNWQLACSEDELERFKSSAARHFRQWLRGDMDEDHMAAVVFNLNAAEYVKAKINHPTAQFLARVKASMDAVVLTPPFTCVEPDCVGMAPCDVCLRRGACDAQTKGVGA